jgi:hypothetical protein
MTPKEKAEELVLKYLRLQEEGSLNWFHKILAKKCALIAVDEILRSHHNLYGLNNKEVKFYLEVQQEIEKL